MVLQVNGSPYTLHFAHRKDEQEHWMTKCVVHEGKCAIKGHGESFGDHELGVGIARCNPAEDQFNKPRGRVVALKRALSNFPREQRNQIWLAYFGVVGSYPQKP